MMMRAPWTQSPSQNPSRPHVQERPFTSSVPNAIPLPRTIMEHARLRFPKGEEARHYNVLQKLSYNLVIFLLGPVMVLTGLTMSPTMNAAAPWLLDIFGGRQSARTIHFLVALGLVAFVIIHVVAVLLSGAWNNLRSMLTGRYLIKGERDDR